MNSVFEKIIDKFEEIRVKPTCNKEKCDKCSRLRNGDIDWYENIDNWT